LYYVRVSFPRASDLLRVAIRDRVTPCAVAEVGDSAGPAWREAAGFLSYAPGAAPATPATVFDLASLTKVVATTTLAMRLGEAGRLELDARVADLSGDWRSSDRASVTVADLLEHAAGLPAVLPLYEAGAGRAAFEAAICAAPLTYCPRTASVYSDLGFILLGFLLEDAGGAPLDRQFAAVAAVHEWEAQGEVLRYGTEGVAVGRVAPTQFDSWRGRLLRGEVDDRNGAALDGVAGHTGLFATAAAVGRFARDLLGAAAAQAPGPALARAATVERFRRRSTVQGSSRALGWDTMLPTSSCGTRMSRRAFGHTGFTGTSLWIDPEVDRYAVLLTNRVHPEAGSPDPIRMLRRAFHDAVWS
jgi:CubicO group peptidase (beta-lactamase class C family)